MRNIFCIVVICCFSIAKAQDGLPLRKIEIDTILSGKMSVRALHCESSKVWYAADQGRFGFVDVGDNTVYEKRISFDSLKPEFRSMAATKDFIYLMSITNPALLYQIDKKTNKAKLVYSERHPKVFYDSMKFWNDREGIALGDPTDDCFSILTTRDGGFSWQKLLCDSFPKLADGEAAFAASNTNIAVSDDKCWIVSGGKKARVFYSPDKGVSWQVHDSPITQGYQMSGIYTADFYDGKNGMIAGGNYDEPDNDVGNKAVTADGGKTWRLVSENAGFGYASCVQYIPESDGKQLACVGGTGLWCSSDGGLSWKKLHDDKSLYVIAFADAQTAYAAGKDKIIRIRFKK